MATLISYGRAIRSVFQLLGDKENDITSSICWALVKCPVFMKVIVNHVCGVDAEQTGKHFLELLPKLAPRSNVQSADLITLGSG